MKKVNEELHHEESLKEYQEGQQGNKLNWIKMIVILKHSLRS